MPRAKKEVKKMKITKKEAEEIKNKTVSREEVVKDLGEEKVKEIEKNAEPVEIEVGEEEVVKPAHTKGDVKSAPLAEPEVKKNLYIQGKAVASVTNKLQSGKLVKEVLDVEGTTFTLSEEEFTNEVIEK